MKKTASKKEVPAVNNSYGIYVGTPPETIQSVQAAINDILAAQYVDNETKRTALNVLLKSCSIENIAISDCNVTV